MVEPRTSALATDPVCGMAVAGVDEDPAIPSLTHEGVRYRFCSTGCLLEFRDDPAWFLDPDYTPSMA